MHYDPSRFGSMRKREDGSEVAEGGHDEIRPTYRDKFAARISFLFAEREWHLSLEKKDDFMEYPMSENSIAYLVIGRVR